MVHRHLNAMMTRTFGDCLDSAAAAAAAAAGPKGHVRRDRKDGAHLLGLSGATGNSHLGSSATLRTLHSSRSSSMVILLMRASVLEVVLWRLNCSRQGTGVSTASEHTERTEVLFKFPCLKRGILRCLRTHHAYSIF